MKRLAGWRGWGISTSKTQLVCSKPRLAGLFFSMDVCHVCSFLLGLQPWGMRILQFTRSPSVPPDPRKKTWFHLILSSNHLMIIFSQVGRLPKQAERGHKHPFPSTIPLPFVGTDLATKPWRYVVWEDFWLLLTNRAHSTCHTPRDLDQRWPLVAVVAPDC